MDYTSAEFDANASLKLIEASHSTNMEDTTSPNEFKNNGKSRMDSDRNSLDHDSEIESSLQQSLDDSSANHVLDETALQTKLEVIGPQGQCCESQDVLDEMFSVYTHIYTNEFKGRANGRVPKEFMVCSCKYVKGRDDISKACGDGCINRELCIECSAEDCPCGVYCQNRCFQLRKYPSLQVFRAPLKGMGLKAKEFISKGSFIIEYCGEVLSLPLFKKRVVEYSQNNAKHFYFMSLKSDEWIDASKKANISRFINHSCAPNCVLQKWTVGDGVRIGIFAIKDITVGQELCFDYKMERYGMEAQQCHCGEPNCKGFIGGNNRASKTAEEIEAYDGLDDEEEESCSDADALSKSGKKKKKDINAVRALTSHSNVKKAVKLLIQKPSSSFLVTNVLKSLIATSDQAILLQFIAFHGLPLLHQLLKEYQEGSPNVVYVLRILKNLPIPNRRPALLKMEELFDSVYSNDRFDPDIRELVHELKSTWATLPVYFKISKISQDLQNTNGSLDSSRTPSVQSAENGDRRLSKTILSDSSYLARRRSLDGGYSDSPANSGSEASFVQGRPSLGVQPGLYSKPRQQPIYVKNTPQNGVSVGKKSEGNNMKLNLDDKKDSSCKELNSRDKKSPDRIDRRRYGQPADRDDSAHHYSAGQFRGRSPERHERDPRNEDRRDGYHERGIGNREYHDRNRGRDLDGNVRKGAVYSPRRPHGRELSREDRYEPFRSQRDYGSPIESNYSRSTRSFGRFDDGRRSPRRPRSIDRHHNADEPRPYDRRDYSKTEDGKPLSQDSIVSKPKRSRTESGSNTPLDASISSDKAGTSVEDSSSATRMAINETRIQQVIASAKANVQSQMMKKQRMAEKEIEKSITEEERALIKKELSEIVKKQMSRFKDEVSVDEFKHLAKTLTKALTGKTVRSARIKNGQLSDHAKESAKQWVKEYLSRHGHQVTSSKQ